MFHSRREKFAVWSKCILLTGFVLSFLAYIGLFIAPTVFDLQVVVAPQRDNYNQKSLYYLKHVSPTDIHVDDVLIYMDESSRPVRTTVTGTVKKTSIPTLQGSINYGQCLGVKQQEFEVLGDFYAFSLSETGRKMVLAYVTLVFLINYLLSYWTPRAQKTEVTSADVAQEISDATSHSDLPSDKTATSIQPNNDLSQSEGVYNRFSKFVSAYHSQTSQIASEESRDKMTHSEQVSKKQQVTAEVVQVQLDQTPEVEEIRTFAKTHDKEALVDYFIANWISKDKPVQHLDTCHRQVASEGSSKLDKRKGLKSKKSQDTGLQFHNQKASDKSSSLPEQAISSKTEMSASGKTKKFGRYQGRHTAGKHSF